jgi:hypothetical protein
MCPITHHVPSLLLPFHDHSLVNSSNGSLSLSTGCPMLLLLATSSATLNKTTGGGGPSSYMGCPLPCAPGSVGRKPCGQGPPQLRPDGAGQFGGKVVNQDFQEEDDDDNDEEDDKTSSNRWVLGSGSPGSFCLALWGPLGLWHPWFLCRALQWGSSGGRCVSRLAPDLRIFSVPTSVAVPVVHRNFIWRPTVSPLISGSTCVV